jgi:adenylate cyclase
MPAWEATQYALGLALPALLVAHVVGTRIAWWRFGADDPYPRIVLVLWMLAPELGARQALTLVLAWLHACIGVHYWLRFRPWYPRAAPWLFAVALLLPTSALLGFVAAGREVSALARTPGWTESVLRATHAPGPAEAAQLLAIRRGFLDAYLLAPWHRRRARPQATPSGALGSDHHPRRPVVSAPQETISTRAGWPASRTSVCGGRAARPAGADRAGASGCQRQARPSGACWRAWAPRRT